MTACFKSGRFEILAFVQMWSPFRLAMLAPVDARAFKAWRALLARSNLLAHAQFLPVDGLRMTPSLRPL